MDTAEAVKLLEHMKAGDTLRRERSTDCPRCSSLHPKDQRRLICVNKHGLVWHFQRYHGGHWIDVSQRLLADLAKAIN